MRSYRSYLDEVARVDVGAETEMAGGWSYQVRVAWPDGVETEHVITLSWSDHDHICAGAAPPSKVVEIMVDLMTRELDAEHVPQRLDASTLRRVIPDLDERIRARL